MKNKDMLFLILACLIVLIFIFITPIGGMSEGGMHVLGIFLASVLLWITIGINWPSLFCILMLMSVPGISMRTVIANSIGNPAISFLLFTFCCSHVLSTTAFTRRCAIFFLSSRFARRGPWWFLILYFASILTLGSFMSTTLIVVIYLAINEEIFAMLELEKGNRFAALLTMGLVIVASISGAMTPIAHVFPLTAMSIYENVTGLSISYFAYMAGGIPAAIIATVIMLFMFRVILKPDVSVVESIDLQSMKDSLPPVNRRERMVVTIFFFVVALWVLPELLKGVFPAISKYISSFGTVGPPLLGALIMCIVQDENKKPLMNLGDAVKSVPWPSLLMAGSALALGSAMTSSDIGLSEWVQDFVGLKLGSFSGFAMVLVLLVFTALMTNVGSNMVTVAIVTTVGIPMAMAMGETVNAGALAVVLGMMSTYAFATPAAMTTVSLGTGSGWTNNAQMAKYGFLFLIPSILVVAFIAYPISSLFL